MYEQLEGFLEEFDDLWISSQKPKEPEIKVRVDNFDIYLN
jgi:hypothetical protein